jgi:hypothetical protein
MDRDIEVVKMEMRWEVIGDEISRQTDGGYRDGNTGWETHPRMPFTIQELSPPHIKHHSPISSPKHQTVNSITFPTPYMTTHLFKHPQP